MEKSVDTFARRLKLHIRNDKTWMSAVSELAEITTEDATADDSPQLEAAATLFVVWWKAQK